MGPPKDDVGYDYSIGVLLSITQGWGAAGPYCRGFYLFYFFYWWYYFRVVTLLLYEWRGGNGLKTLGYFRRLFLWVVCHLRKDGYGDGMIRVCSSGCNSIVLLR